MYKRQVSYAGRSAYIQLDPDLRARLEFVSLNIAGQYNALKLTILNRTEGAVDVNILRFGDLLGKKKVSNPNFSDGILPHLWDDYGKVDWYVYQPTQADYRLLALSLIHISSNRIQSIVGLQCGDSPTAHRNRLPFPAYASSFLSYISSFGPICSCSSSPNASRISASARIPNAS